MKRAHPEDDIQRALFQWITLATPRIPQLALAFHPANGGKRDPREAARLKGLGVRPGVPDVMIPVPQMMDWSDKKRPLILSPMKSWDDDYPDRREVTCTGLAIELKSATGVLSKNQKWWLEKLGHEGWEVHVCRSFDEARQVIADYFGVKP